MTDKEKIVEIFHRNVKGKKPDVSDKNTRHDGKYGHWLEKQFGIHANGNNEADLYGYELKNETASKTTFGDWSANEYVYKDNKFSHIFNIENQLTAHDKFCEIFGKPNESKGGRCSWSGSPCPTIYGYNDFGQVLTIEKNKDIVALYSYSKDNRSNKESIVPYELQIENLVLARWFGTVIRSQNRRDKTLQAKLEDKFNQAGWFTCKTDSDGTYQKICFGAPMNYDSWLHLVSQGIVYFDSGMYQGNGRPYSQWRADNSLWDSLIVDTFV